MFWEQLHVTCKYCTLSSLFTTLKDEVWLSAPLSIHICVTFISFIYTGLLYKFLLQHENKNELLRAVEGRVSMYIHFSFALCYISCISSFNLALQEEPVKNMQYTDESGALDL